MGRLWAVMVAGLLAGCSGTQSQDAGILYCIGACVLVSSELNTKGEIEDVEQPEPGND